MDSTSIDWHRIPIDAATLKGFTRKSDLRGFLQAGSFLLIFLATTSAAFVFFRMRLWIPMALVCHTVKVNPLIGFLYWHMNYHAEHHMYAAVPFFNLAGFHNAIRGDMQMPQKSCLACIRLLVQIKKRQKDDPSYVYVPEFQSTAAPPRRE
jgi:fatty acid desaturase